MNSKSGVLSGKKGIVIGVANERSIAWGIAKEAFSNGADIAFSYQGKAIEKRLRPLAQSLESTIIEECDVTIPSSIDSFFAKVSKEWGKIDFMIHAVAYSDKEGLKGRYIDTTKENFLRTMEISCFSFTDLCNKAVNIMPDGGSLLTLSYYGAERVMPHYNVMGVAKAALESSVKYLATDLGRKNIRVNALSAGPMKTLAASGINNFRFIMKWNELNAPLQKNVTQEDVGKSGVYLISDLSSGVTGEIHHVDCGYNTVGMLEPSSAHEISDLLKKVDFE